MVARSSHSHRSVRRLPFPPSHPLMAVPQRENCSPRSGMTSDPRRRGISRRAAALPQALVAGAPPPRACCSSRWLRMVKHKSKRCLVTPVHWLL
ncbi:hypothetical protein HU200_028234 [Digitaria exilis]|uniref:Uncharacterized protein n=1 Tax=Digitaria exilis TaxID=1010633 RepID=A0A835C0F7_9POAL|nr:hypothetical protein HU200_028234 [Digitaria exilis]